MPQLENLCAAMEDPTSSCPGSESWACFHCTSLSQNTKQEKRKPTSAEAQKSDVTCPPTQLTVADTRIKS